MGRRQVRVPFGDWTGGLNQDDNPGALAINELRRAVNVYWEGRALASRRGSSRLQTTSINAGAAGVGVYDFARAGGTSRDIVCVFGNQMLKDALTSTPTNITGTVTITAGQNNQCQFANFNEECIIVNGVDAPWKWTGTGNAALLGGTPPVFGTILAKWNRVFGAGHTAARRTIRFSDLGTHETWTAANTVRAVLGDASGAIEGRDWILQLGHLGDTLFVGLAHSVGRVFYTGDSTTPFSYRQIAEFGVIGRNTYVPIGSDGYFLSDRGVHYVTASAARIDYAASLVSGRRLRDFWSGLNRSRLQYAVGDLYRTAAGNFCVVWSMSDGGSTTNNVWLVMDVTDGPGRERFTIWTGLNANTLAAIRDPTSLVEKLVFCTTDGFVWQADTTDADNTAAYVKEAATRWEDFGLPAAKKNLRSLYIESAQFGAYDLNIDSIFDYSTTPTQTLTQSLTGATQAAWGTAVWGTDKWPTLGFVRDYLFATNDGVVMSWRFYTTGATQRWKVYRFVPAVQASAESKESTP